MSGHFSAVVPRTRQTANDFMVICNVAKILELVVPLMEHPSETFLATIEEDLMKLIIKHGMTVCCCWSRLCFENVSARYVDFCYYTALRELFKNILISVSRWCSTVWAAWELLSTKWHTTINLCGPASKNSMVRFTAKLRLEFDWAADWIVYLRANSGVSPQIRTGVTQSIIVAVDYFSLFSPSRS